MKRATLATVGTIFAAGLTFGQSPEPLPKFEAADVHVSPKAPSGSPFGQFARTGPIRANRYEVRSASMVDLIRIAYGFDTDKILGGPNWLEMDRFDVIGKVPKDSTAETHKQMLQAVLEDRFQLKVHKETKPLPSYALVVGKKPQMKEASGQEETGCKPQSGPAAGEGVIHLMMSNADGKTTTLNLGPGMTVNYSCRNMTMEAFASNLRSMMGANVGNNPVKDDTGLKGAWNFDIKYSMAMMGPMMGNNGDRITIFEAVDKQLGLKLEERPIPTPVMVVDSVNRKPSENPADIAETLPPLTLPTEFEVASVKLVEGELGAGPRMMRFNVQPGGRVISEGMPLRFLISRAFNSNNNEQIVGIPAFANTDRYDINAKVPSGGPPITNADTEALAPLLLSLLKDRFKMTYHTEDRPVTAYTLVAGKPKMKKADPNSRSSCKSGNAPAGSAPGSRALTCQNVTMDQFVERLQNATSELTWPVQNETRIEGGFDFTLVYSMGGPMMMAMRGGGGEGGPGGGGGGDRAVAGGAGLASASEPMDAYTIFEAVEKQLGLKLEKQKRSAPVYVIDHLEQKPTEN